MLSSELGLSDFLARSCLCLVERERERALVVALELAVIIVEALGDPVLFWKPRRKLPRKSRLATGTDMPLATEDGAIGDHLGEQDGSDEDSVAAVDSGGLDEEPQSCYGGEHAFGILLEAFETLHEEGSVLHV